MQVLFGSVLLSLCCGLNPTPAGGQEELAKLALKAAEDHYQACLKEDYAKALDYVHPKLLEKMGGREKMIRMMKGFADWGRQEGIFFSGYKVHAPTAIAEAGGDAFVVIPITMEVTEPTGKTTWKDYLIAVSSDRGKTWTFFGSDQTVEELRELLPNFPQNLTLPPSDKKVVEMK